MSPTDGSHFSGDSVEIAYALRSPSGLTVDRLDVLADDKLVPASGFEKTSSPEAMGHILVTLPKKDTTVSLVAQSGNLASAPVSVKLAYGSPSAADLMKPKLYALLVGVTGYDNPLYDNLHFAAHDAEGLAKALMAQKGGLYADVRVKVIDDRNRPDTDPTRSNVENGLYWLQHEATSHDVSIVFLSGHGYIDAKQKYWFLTRETDLDRLRSTAISNDDLFDIIGSIPGKKVVFVDSAHAGGVAEASTQISDIVVFGAATRTEVAKEDAKWDNHGAFTKALIEAIGEGKASLGKDGQITTDMLDLYLVQRVQELTGGSQHPFMSRSARITDFPLALVRS